jgi:hypothetical protein
VVALFHLVRIYMGWPVMIGDWSVPMWVSWIGLVVPGGLALFGLSLQSAMHAETSRPPQSGGPVISLNDRAKLRGHQATR